MRKDHIKTTLEESYIKNIDYKVIKGVLTGKKGKPNEKFYLHQNVSRLWRCKVKLRKQ